MRMRMASAYVLLGPEDVEVAEQQLRHERVVVRLQVVHRVVGLLQALSRGHTHNMYYSTYAQLFDGIMSNCKVSKLKRTERYEYLNSGHNTWQNNLINRAHAGYTRRFCSLPVVYNKLFVYRLHMKKFQ